MKSCIPIVTHDPGSDFWLTISEQVCFYWLVYQPLESYQVLFFVAVEMSSEIWANYHVMIALILKIKASYFAKAAMVLKIYFPSLFFSSFLPQTYWRVYSQVLSTQQRCLTHLCLLTCSKLTQVKIHFSYYFYNLTDLCPRLKWNIHQIWNWFREDKTGTSFGSSGQCTFYYSSIFGTQTHVEKQHSMPETKKLKNLNVIKYFIITVWET